METQTESTKHEMAIMDMTGDTKVIWDKNNPDEVDAAKSTFKKLKAKGYAAFCVTGKNGDRGEQMHEFDPNAERLIMVPPMVGG